MFRKKRLPGPFFRMPGTPLAPIKGEHAPLGRPARKGTTLAIFQVVAADTHDNYIVCRGFEAETDQNFVYLHDPYAHPETTPINVAKPYAIRGTFPYSVGQLVVAARIRTRLGENQGVASVTVGQPASLSEEIVMLFDDSGVAVSWLDLGASSGVSLGVPFLNFSGETIPPGAVMAPLRTVTSSGTDHVLVGKPSSTFHRRWLVNGLGFVPPGFTSLGSWLGDLTGLVGVDPGSLSMTQFFQGWGPRPGSWWLFPGYFGFTIHPPAAVYFVSGSWVAHARQHEVNTLIGLRLTTSLPYDSFGIAEIWRRTPANRRIVTEFNNIDVWDGMKLLQGDQIDQYHRIDAGWNGDEWELLNASCDPDPPTSSGGSQNQPFNLAVVSPAAPSFPAMA